MSKISGQSAQTANGRWNDAATREVGEVQTAITSHMSDRTVGDDMAPMMAELLARLDSFVAADEAADLEAPRPPSLGEPPSLEQEASAMSSGAHKVRQFANGAGDPETRAKLADMSQVLDEHLRRRHEVLARADRI